MSDQLSERQSTSTAAAGAGDEHLGELAREARARAYAPYSGYTVGAALRTRAGKIYLGANIENAAYGESMCAERVAIYKAVSEGERDFEALAVATENGGSPCGACRQVLSEFAPDMRVLILDAAGGRRETRVRDLLPDYFGPAQLGVK
jgi:cytidine deaminase